MKKIFVSGAFNILHAGHVQFLKEAKALGDYLIVAVPDEKTLWSVYHKKAVLSDTDKRIVLQSLSSVDRVYMCTGEQAGIDFKEAFLEEQPQILAVTIDDQFSDLKKQLCAQIGAQYVVLDKTPPQETQISCTQMVQKMKAPEHVPVRVDFAGGWLDVPAYQKEGAYIVNCAVSPTVSKHEWLYRKGAGLGGSGAWSVLNGWDPVKSELGLGVGWQDPAVISETGACVWRSGDYPVLDFKNTGSFLKGKMAVYDTRQAHHTPGLANKKRDFDKIARAGHIARLGVFEQDLAILAVAVQLSYQIQLEEGMDELPHLVGAEAFKYCGGGHGGYALYLFETAEKREKALAACEQLYPVEPYCRTFGKDEAVEWEPRYKERLKKQKVIV